MEESNTKVECHTFLYSFPFWIFLDKRNPPVLEMTQFEGVKIRIYPPFRSGEPNWIPMPLISKSNTPFLKGREPKKMNRQGYFMTMSAMPQLKIDGLQDTGQFLVWGDSCKSIDPNNFPMDSLRIDILDITKQELEKNIQKFVKKLLNHVRIRSNQWWINRSIDPLLGWKRNTFLIDSYGTPKEPPIALANGHTPSGIERPITAQTWSKSIKSAAEAENPEIHSELYLDAHYYFASGDFRRMVIDLATGIENLKDITFERLWSDKNIGKYRKGKVLKGYDIADHLDRDLKRLINRSLKDEDINTFYWLEIIWDARGNVAHGAEPYYRCGGEVIYVESENSKSMLQSARKIIKWLKDL